MKQEGLNLSREGFLKKILENLFGRSRKTSFRRPKSLPAHSIARNKKGDWRS